MYCGSQKEDLLGSMKLHVNNCRCSQSREELNTDNAIHNGEDGESHPADLTQHLQSFPAKDLGVAHLNVCSIRNKMDELRCLWLLCKFDMIVITETRSCGVYAVRLVRQTIQNSTSSAPLDNDLFV